MRAFSAADGLAAVPASAVTPMDEAARPARATFSTFGRRRLHVPRRPHARQRCRAGVTCQRDGMIARAIGPMEIMPDNTGTARLLQQYFVVLPEYQDHGLGAISGGAAMQWGSSTRPTTRPSRPRPAARPTACAIQKDSPTSARSAPPCCGRNRAMSPMNLMSSRVLASAEPPEVRDRVQLVQGEAGTIPDLFAPSSFDAVLCQAWPPHTATVLQPAGKTARPVASPSP